MGGQIILIQRKSIYLDSIVSKTLGIANQLSILTRHEVGSNSSSELRFQWTPRKMAPA